MGIITFGKKMVRREESRWDELTSKPLARKLLTAFFVLWAVVLVLLGGFIFGVLMADASPSRDYVSLEVVEMRLEELRGEDVKVEAKLNTEQTLQLDVIKEGEKVSLVLWETEWDLIGGEYFVSPDTVGALYNGELTPQ